MDLCGLNLPTPRRPTVPLAGSSICKAQAGAQIRFSKSHRGKRCHPENDVPLTEPPLLCLPSGAAGPPLPLALSSLATRDVIVAQAGVPPCPTMLYGLLCASPPLPSGSAEPQLLLSLGEAPRTCQGHSQCLVGGRRGQRPLLTRKRTFPWTLIWR